MTYQYRSSILSQQATKRLFAEKIAHYAQREPKHFLQIDGIFAAGRYDEQTPIDLEGDFLDACRTVELMHGSDVRRGASPALARLSGVWLFPVGVIYDRRRKVQEYGNCAQIRKPGSDLLAVQQ